MILKGLKVVEFATYIAAPGAAGVLGDWGAEVIKIERPGGDEMRHVFADAKSELSANPTFEMDNRGKRSVVLDTVSYTHLRAHETPEHLVCRLLLEKKKI